MKKYASPLLALVASTSSASAFVAPSGARPFVVSSTSLAADAVPEEVVEPPPLSPLTRWGDRIDNIRSVQAAYRAAPSLEFGPTITAESVGLASDDKEGQLKYFEDNATEIKQKMQDCGAVHFNGFDLMKEQEGFQAMYNALGMKVCLDPLHSVSARPTVDGQKNSPVYEAVNKESRKNFFIGELDLCPRSWEM